MVEPFSGIRTHFLLSLVRPSGSDALLGLCCLEETAGGLLLDASGVEGAALPGQGGGAVEGGTGGEAEVGQGREGGAEPSVGGAEARVGKTLVEVVAARWPARAEANCRAAMWVALERKRGMG